MHISLRAFTAYFTAYAQNVNMAVGCCRVDEVGCPGRNIDSVLGLIEAESGWPRDHSLRKAAVEEAREAIAWVLVSCVVCLAARLTH